MVKLSSHVGLGSRWVTARGDARPTGNRQAVRYGLGARAVRCAKSGDQPDNRLKTGRLDLSSWAIRVRLSRTWSNHFRGEAHFWTFAGGGPSPPRGKGVGTARPLECGSPTQSNPVKPISDRDLRVQGGGVGEFLGGRILTMPRIVKRQARGPALRGPLHRPETRRPIESPAIVRALLRPGTGALRTVSECARRLLAADFPLVFLGGVGRVF